MSNSSSTISGFTGAFNFLTRKPTLVKLKSEKPSSTVDKKDSRIKKVKKQKTKKKTIPKETSTSNMVLVAPQPLTRIRKQKPKKKKNKKIVLWGLK